MLVVARAEQKGGGIDCASRDHKRFGANLERSAVALCIGSDNTRAAGVRAQAIDTGRSLEPHMSGLERRVDTAHFSVALGFDAAGEAVACGTADAAAALAYVDRHRHRIRARTGGAQPSDEF